MKNWARTKIVKLNSLEEFQAVLDTVKEQCINIYFRKRNYYEPICQNAFIHEKDSKYEVTFKPGLKAVTYVFDRDGEYLIQTTPKDAVSAMSRVYKIQRTEEIMGIEPKYIESAKPLLYKNNKYDGKATPAYEYDLKSAYAQMLKLPLPDLRTAQYDVKVGKNQVGFFGVGPELWCTFEEGRECQYVFDLMPSPYIKWVDRIEKMINKETDPHKKTELKSKYRFSIGDLQNLNPFWRGIIVERCNKLVGQYIDKHTIYCNTDGLVSETRRLDIENSTEFNWVLKSQGRIFKWQKGKMNYQWDDEIPAYKGPSKRRIKYYNETHDKPWDILVNGLPKVIEHKYNLNKEELKIYEED